MSSKVRFQAVTLLVIVACLVAACQGQNQAVVEIPTLAVLPSLTPSNTPTDTPIPTFTDTPTLTPTPTDTETPIPTNTFTPTLTNTPSITPTFTVTPTDTDTATPPATNTPTATIRPPATATPNAPVINSFTVNQNVVAPNTQVQLAWSTVSDTARIEVLNQSGAVVQTIPVTPTGQIPVVVPGNLGRIVTYRLVAIRGGQEANSPLGVQVQCSVSWFFGDQFAPADAGCPTALGAIAAGSYQRFERGLMLYVTANGLNRVYGLQNDGNRYISYVSGYDDDYDDIDDAPDDKEDPDDEFNWVFYNTNAPVGSWLDAIGWATDDKQLGDRTIQFETTGAFYIDGPDGEVYRFSGGDSGTWTRIR